MPVLNTTHHPENRETTVLLRPKDLHRPSVAGLVAFVAIYFNCFSENYFCLMRQTIEPSVILTNWFVLRMKESVISVIIKSGFTEQ